MKKITLSAVFVALSVLSASSFAASNNTIRFLGEVADQTCTVSVNGNQATPSVLLPTVSLTGLKAGTDLGETTFTVGVSGCTVNADAAQAVGVNFLANNIASYSGSNYVGNVLTGSTAATGVGFSIYDSAAPSTNLDITGATTVKPSGFSVAAGDTSANYDFGVKYAPTSATPTIGKVEGNVQISISYL